MTCQECRHREEAALAMAERTIRRLWITILTLIVLMAGMAVGFFAYESQFTDVETWEGTEIDASQFGNHNFVSGGDLRYGVSEGADQESH